jgi:hypothetical protein
MLTMKRHLWIEQINIPAGAEVTLSLDGWTHVRVCSGNGYLSTSLAPQGHEPSRVACLG